MNLLLRDQLFGARPVFWVWLVATAAFAGLGAL